MSRDLRIRLAFLAVLCVASMPSQCQDDPGAERPEASTTDSGSANTDAQLKESASSQFILGPADIIRISVWKNVELSQTVTVGPDGFVSVPLLGDVHVAGMTANQLGHSLASRLKSFVVNPQVTVSIVDIRSRQVYVLGQVAKPGGFPLVAPINVLQLIAQAGGLTTYANRKSIKILRLQANRLEQFSFNYNNVIHGDAKQNITLEPGDTVVVP